VPPIRMGIIAGHVTYAGTSNTEYNISYEDRAELQAVNNRCTMYGMLNCLGICWLINYMCTRRPLVSGHSKRC
jgi:hypothetical protein